MSPPPPLPPPPPPPGVAGIAARNDLQTKQPRIPWRTKSGDYHVVVYTQKDGVVTSGDVMADPDLVNAALDSYLEHYFPEYYPLIYGENAMAIADHESRYLSIRSEIQSAMVVTSVAKTDMAFLGRPFKRDTKIVFNITGGNFNFATERKQMVDANTLPSFEIALDAFNAAQDFGVETKSVNFEMTTAPDLIEQLSGQLNSLGDLHRQMAQQLNYNVDFNMMQKEIRQIINHMLTMVYDTIDPEGRRPPIEGTDYITMSFDDDNHIIKIEYFFINITEGNTELSKVGYFTNIKNNIVLQNHLNLNILANYEEILEDAEANSGLGQQTDIMGFFEKYGAAAASGNPGEFGQFGVPFGPDSPGQPPLNNIFGASPLAGAGAGSRLIQPDRQLNAQDFEDLTKKIKSFISYEEVAKLDEVANDPELKSRMIQKEKAKKINAAVQVTKIIDKFATFNFPLAGPNKSKEARVINQVLSQFGIQQLAMEAIVCLTFGVGAAVQRITGAVREALVGTDLYNRPRNPSDEFSLERPSLGDFKIYFSITGDPPLGKQILNIVLSALANAGFEIIKTLADLIKLNCNQILRGKQGQLNCGEELRRLNESAMMDIPDLGDLLNEVAQGYGFGNDQAAYAYFEDVSTILDTVELCRLLNSPLDVETSTLNKIVAFNRDYRAIHVRTYLATGNQVVSYFQEMSQYVDTTTLCNNAINEGIQEAIASCTICLDDDFYTGLEKNVAIEELTNLLENGPNIEIPPFDFMCPDSEWFMDNPVYSRIIPNTFNTLVNSIKMYLGGSLESARSSLLIDVLTNEPSPGRESLQEYCSGSPGSAVQGPGMCDDEELKMTKNILNIIKDIFSKLAAGIEFIKENADSPICADLDLSKFPDPDALLMALEAITQGLAASPDAIQAVADNITAAQGAIDAGGGGPAIPPTVVPTFPIIYKNAFANAIGMLDFGFSSWPPTIGSRVEGSWNSSTGGIASGSIIKSLTEYADIGGSPTYEEIIFGFDFRRDQESVHSTDDILITYPPYTTDEASYLSVNYDIPLHEYSPNPAALPLNGSFSHGVTSNALPVDEHYKTKSLNPYVYRFVAAYGAGTLTPDQDWMAAAAVEFPLVQAASMRRVFDYCLRNGSFSAARVENLNLFKKNTDCSPANVGDLMDSDGIIDQMKKDLTDAMCSTNAGVNITEAVRQCIKFGIINLLIQAILVQFIIKNIVVFSAFRMSDIFSARYPIRNYIISQVAIEVRRYSTSNPQLGTLLRDAITEYFVARSGRVSSVENGGITHSYASSTVATGLADPSYTNIGNIQSMVEFMVDERINYVWDQTIEQDSETGAPTTQGRSTMTAITNIIDGKGNKKEYADAFLENVVGVYNGFKEMWADKTSAGATTSVGLENFLSGDAIEILGNIGIVKEVTIPTISLSPSAQNLFGSTGNVTLSVDEFMKLGTDYAGNIDIAVQYSLYLFDKGGTEKHANDAGVAMPYHWAPSDEHGLYVTAYKPGWPDPEWLPKRLMSIPVASVTNINAMLLTAGAWQALPSSITSFFGNVSSVTGNLIVGVKKSDYDFLRANTELQLFLDQCASQNTAILVALLYNLYLTDKHFSATTDSFNTTITAILNLLQTTENTKNPPTLRTGSGADTFNNNMESPENNLEDLGREILLKFLRETPLQILKGLCELIDPHVALHKFIRNITGEGFNVAAKAVTTVIDSMPDEPPNPLKTHGATGEDVLALAFCGYNLANQFGSEAGASDFPAGPSGADTPLYGPKITLDGVDFTGTVAGLFIMPPSPFGIIYIIIKALLDQIEFPDGSEEEESTDAESEDNEC
tara:strand:+ start:25565 stop:31003 length:5439 start_codon:yes stop_codon:yes gene_type:complete